MAFVTGCIFREYVFYPVSTSKLFLKLNVKIRDHLGNVIGKVFAASIPILCVWVLTGLWHGAKWNYIAWGLYHGVLICMSTLFEEPLAKLTKALRIKTDCISWEIFRNAQNIHPLCHRTSYIYGTGNPKLDLDDPFHGV